MLGFVIGTVCLVGLFGLMAGRRHGCGHHRHHGWHGRRGRGGRGHRHGAWQEGFARAAGERIKHRLRVDEDQEDIVDLAFADLRTAMTELGRSLRDSRRDLAGAFRGEAVDDAALDAVFAIHDEEIASARRAAVSALKQIHAVLRPEQRARAADWFDTSGPEWI